MKENQFQMYELEALLGDYKHEYDVQGIIDDATEVDDDGDRVWTAFGEELYEIIDRHERHRTKAEFRAMRETLGITQQRLANDLGVKVLSIKRWESPKYPQTAPGDAWELLDDLMDVQDSAVSSALAIVQGMQDETGKRPNEVTLPYWSSQSDYLEHHYVEDDGDWTEVNATNRRVSSLLRWLGFEVRWVDGADNVVNSAKTMGK